MLARFSVAELRRRLLHMGTICSNPEKDDVEGEKDETVRILKSQRSKRLQKTAHNPIQHRAASTESIIHAKADMEQAQTVVDAHDAIVLEKSSQKRLPPTVLDARRMTRSAAAASVVPARFADVADYESQRGEVIRREHTIAWDYRREVLASERERRANRIVRLLRERDDQRVYEAAPPREGYGGQMHARHPGDHFLSNVDLIERTELFRVASRMPKGAHLHIHFNACLLPNVLLGIAKSMDRMFITSDLPLVRLPVYPPAESAAADDGAGSWVNYNRCEIQFSILRQEKERPGNLFDPAYQPRQTMRFRDFLNEFPSHYTEYTGVTVDQWLENKLVFSEEEAHGWLQTVLGSWEKFNGRTRMMKGLFNYVSAYRHYTRLVLNDFVRDNIQYAEIRPNFMKTNQLFSDDGKELIDNVGIMEIIIDEYERFQEEKRGYFGGLKIIYCTPRSFSNELVAHALRECIEFKKRWPEWIAGFDLVGEEAKGKPIHAFVPEFLEFQKRCEAEGLDIPFLFHCGETLEMGSETDGNLVDALLLGSKRIGHGFALSRHPYIMEHMKKRGVCLEVCPISNEILGLTPRAAGHSMYSLLANNVHCTVSSDNGTIFRSTLSHDFYQVMIGKSDMTLHGWRQLIEWSLQHSCMTDEERKPVYAKWEELWNNFLQWILDEYGSLENGEAAGEARL